MKLVALAKLLRWSMMKVWVDLPRAISRHPYYCERPPSSNGKMTWKSILLNIYVCIAIIEYNVLFEKERIRAPY